MTRARDVADVQDNLGGAVPPFVAGKNKIINGDFGVWQRGTTFNSVASSNVFSSDRFFSNRDGTGATINVTQQTFTPGTAPVAGYEGTYYYQFAQTVAGTGQTYNNILCQSIEDVRTFAGQTVTISFWAKADTTRNLNINLFQYFGTSGSGYVYPSNTTVSVTASWQRFTFTLAMPSVAGKTIGAGSYIQLALQSQSNNATQTWNIWGVQLEAGSVATPFTTATGTIQGELAACQRYYFRATAGTTNGYLGNGFASGTSTTTMQVPFPVTMRIVPTSLDYSNLRVIDQVAGYTGGTYILSSDVSQTMGATYLSGTSGMTQYRPLYLTGTTAAGYIGFSAEL
jgi:hypothetical protein